MKETVLTLTAILACLIFVRCDKSDFLNEKPRKSLVIPTTLDHFQRILDDDVTMNGTGSSGLTPQLGESASDNFYLSTDDYRNVLREQMRNYYVWSPQPYAGENVEDWEFPYKAILNANTVLVGVRDIDSRNGASPHSDFLKGQALFHRAHMYYHLSQVFAQPYTPNSENNGMGLFLRYEADINEKLSRATVHQTYDQIIKDLRQSVRWLNTTPLHKGRASKQAAYGLLARVYLVIGDFENARVYADSCLQIQDQLCDYRLIDHSAQSPFQGVRFSNPINDEVIFYSAMLSAIPMFYPVNPFHAKVDTGLYRSYSEDDLRKKVFFQEYQEGIRFKGSYSFAGYDHYFSGIAVDEMLLIRAECYARANEYDLAVRDMDRLLLSRWVSDDRYVSVANIEKDHLLDFILQERRKELLYRGLRWSDLRRLNVEGYNIAIKRQIDGQKIELMPGDERWTWPTPLEVGSAPTN